MRLEYFRAIPPTQLVDRSHSAYKRALLSLSPAIPPTQLVDRSYSAYKSDLPRLSPAIPPTQLVDRSHSAYKSDLLRLSPAIPSTQLVDRSHSAYKSDLPLSRRKAHQRSSWIVHTRPAAALFSSKLQLSYARAVHLEPFKEISWAYQLHYHICFRTHRRKTVFDDQSRIAALSQALSDLCKANDLHLLEKDCRPKHVQLVLSMRPSQLISDALKRLKGRSSAAICREFGLAPPLWARGYLARSAGRVRIQAVKRYLDSQAAHHGYSTRALPPVFRFRATEPEVLSTAHASFELTHHLVLATRLRRGVFDSKTGQALVNYWMKVAAQRGFGVDQATVLPDHVHLLIQITPKISVEQAALSLMNNGQYFIGKHFPRALVEAKIDQLWEPSAYVGTCGELTTALLKAFLRRADAG